MLPPHHAVGSEHAFEGGVYDYCGPRNGKTQNPFVTMPNDARDCSLAPRSTTRAQAATKDRTDISPQRSRRARRKRLKYGNSQVFVTFVGFGVRWYCSVIRGDNNGH